MQLNDEDVGVFRTEKQDDETQKFDDAAGGPSHKNAIS